ncbi:unnamed protein product, partial [Amoebophrya sp. A25]
TCETETQTEAEPGFLLCRPVRSSMSRQGSRASARLSKKADAVTAAHQGGRRNSTGGALMEIDENEAERQVCGESAEVCDDVGDTVVGVVDPSSATTSTATGPSRTFTLPVVSVSQDYESWDVVDIGFGSDDEEDEDDDGTGEPPILGGVSASPQAGKQSEALLDEKRNDGVVVQSLSLPAAFLGGDKSPRAGSAGGQSNDAGDGGRPLQQGAKCKPPGPREDQSSKEENEDEAEREDAFIVSKVRTTYRTFGVDDIRITLIEGTDEVVVSLCGARPLWTDLAEIAAAKELAAREEGTRRIMKPGEQQTGELDHEGDQQAAARTPSSPKAASGSALSRTTTGTQNKCSICSGTRGTATRVSSTSSDLASTSTLSPADEIIGCDPSSYADWLEICDGQLRLRGYAESRQQWACR